MEAIKIAHISDLHLRKDCFDSFFERELSQRIMPLDYFTWALKEISKDRPDVIVMTGDLIHEGSEEDYRFLRGLLDKYVPDIKVIPALGNHDFKKAFYRGFLEKDEDGPYFAVEYIKNYRFIVIDTAVEGRGDGYFRGERAELLFDELKTGYGEGTIILGHHPFKTDQGWYITDCDADICQRLSETDVIAYLCGHAHFNESRQMGGFVQLVTESFDYGVETVKDEVIYTDVRGYSTVTAEGRDIRSHLHVLTPYEQVFKRFKLGEQV